MKCIYIMKKIYGFMSFTADPNEILHCTEVIPRNLYLHLYQRFFHNDVRPQAVLPRPYINHQPLNKSMRESIYIKTTLVYNFFIHFFLRPRIRFLGYQKIKRTREYTSSCWTFNWYVFIFFTEILNEPWLTITIAWENYFIISIFVYSNNILAVTTV